MKTLNKILIPTLVLVALLAGRASVSAQPRADWANMSPEQIQQQMQQRIMEYFRQQLVVTNDAEWNVIEGRLTKVTRLRMETMFSGGMGMMSAMRGRGSDGGQRGGFRGFPGLGQPSPEAEALQKAIEANAPAEQIQAALKKLREVRKQKKAELAKAQEELRQLLTTRQEATLVTTGVLD